MNQYDIIIIGAGLYGIAAARNYLEVHPISKLLILESEEAIGGTWSIERIYDEFWTQTPLGTAEFSDVPLRLPSEVTTYHGFFPARYVTDYLEYYADSHIYCGKSLRDRILCQHRVTRLERRVAGEWSVLCTSTDSEQRFIASKLIVASDFTSTPYEPTLPSSPAFSGQILHQKFFGQSSFLNNPQVANVTVLGGGKSAADIVYASARAGKHVSWIIREGGGGPAAHTQAAGLGPYENSIEMFGTRVLSSLSPSIFGSQTIWTRILHRTRVGRRIVDWVWKKSDKQNRSIAGYQTRRGAGKGFEELEPDTSIFWQSQGSGICQRPDFWQVIADNVDVHRADIISFHSDTLELSDSSHVPANVLVCATGWESPFPFLSSEQKASLGLPVQLSDEARSDAVKWQALDAAARKKVLHLFPRLADAPSYSERQKATTPYRLYKNMAPLTDNRTILFLGCVQLGNHFMTAEGQALWAVAYFDARLDLPKKEDMEREVAETNMWCRLRYPAKGWDGTFYFFDSLPYVDALLRQVGLKSHQRLWPMTKVAPVKARDLMPLVQEYIAA